MKTILYSIIISVTVVFAAAPQLQFTSLMLFGESEIQQRSGGTIMGTVIDIVDRSPVEKATVELLGSGHKTVTSKDGQFKITGVAEGFYQIRASAAGYDVQTQNNLFVESGKPATSFFMLKKSGMKESADKENVQPVPISTKSPSYPAEAKVNGVEGIFYFNVKVSETGEILSARCYEKDVYADEGKIKGKEVMEKFAQSVNQLEKEALDAIWQWKFKPALRAGVAIQSDLVLPIKFKLGK